MTRFKPFLITFISVLFFYLALPPVSWTWLCFIPPTFWVFLIRGEYAVVSSKKELPPLGSFKKWKYRLSVLFGSFYGQIFIADLLFWGGALVWLPSPHPAIWAGWAPLSVVMALYFLLYIAAARRFLRRWHFPLFLASPLAWVGMEWLRKHILTGFTFCSLEHALYLHPEMIQTAEWGGEYTVGMLIVLIGTVWGIAIESVLTRPRNGKKGILSLLAGVLLLSGMVVYGHYRINQINRICLAAKEGTEPPLKIALLQDSTYYHFPIPSETTIAVHEHYTALTKEAAKAKPDLIVWPEGTFAYPYFAFEPGAQIPTPEGTLPLTPEETREQIKKVEETQAAQIDPWIEKTGSAVILGLIATVYGPEKKRVYNSALYCAAKTPPLRYDKRARVVFGEFIPFMEYLPENFPLKTLCEPISAGQRLGLIPVGPHYQALVSICFESCYARFVRSQLDALRRETTPIDPDFLINISSDAWFFGNSENEFHNSTYPFRAVETRKYYLVASHGGVSLGLTPAGKIFTHGTKGNEEVVYANFTPIKIHPFLNGKGLWMGVGCAWLVVLAFIPFRRKRYSQTDLKIT